MSGLVGLHDRAGEPIDGPCLESMLRSIEHRGPDGAAVWRDEDVGFGHAKLLATPEAVDETLPIVDDETDIALVADARIDNREELLNRLDVDTDGPVTDAELVLAAYRRWRMDCPAHLVGAYAFVIWDPDVRRLFCVRDHVGLKPLYYARGDSCVGVASEPKALFAGLDLPGALNETAIGDFLAYNHADVESTVHEAVKRLPPGHTLTVQDSELTLRRYWALDPDHELEFGSDAACIDALRGRFEEAVRCRLRSPGSIGAMLSGGLDSSAVAATAQNQLASSGRDPVRTYSVIFEDIEAADESEHVETVLGSGTFDPQRIVGDDLDPLADLDQRLERFDGPFDPYLQHLTWHIYKAAAGDVRVLLDGYDGDTVISHGIRRLSELARSGRWAALAREVAALADDPRDRWRLLKNHAIGPSVPKPIRGLYRWVKGGRDPVKRANPILDADFAERIGLAERLRPSTPPTTARERHFELLTNGKITRVLELADHAAATFEIEPRYPFLDRRLMEFCLSLPSEYKLRDGWTRWILREAMDGVLPESIQWREGKADLHPYLVESLRRSGDKGLNDGNPDSPPVSRYLDPQSLMELRRDFESNRSANAAIQLARASVLERWLS